MGNPWSNEPNDFQQSHSRNVSEDTDTPSAQRSGMVDEAPESKDFRSKFKKLIGNTQKLSVSAQKLFAMGRIYLTRNSGDVSQDDGFPNLFKALPQREICNEGATTCDNKKELHGSQSATCDESNIKVDCSDESEASRKQMDKEEEKKIPSVHSTSAQCAQTFFQWKVLHDYSNLNLLCFSPRKTIYLQPLDDFPGFCKEFKLHASHLNLGFFDTLQGFMQIYFSGMDVLVLPPVSVDEKSWKVKSRVNEVTQQKQYCVTDLFPCLETLLPRDGHSILGITWTDLYPEGFNFVLGEASFAHKSAVISFGRFEFKNFDTATHQDVAEINGQLLWKLMRTISHEMCHLFGLSHCVFFSCAMNESSSVMEALSQPLFLCPVCLRKLQQACGFDIFERYQLLLKLIQSIHDEYPDCVHFQDSLLWLQKCIDYLSS